MSGMTVEQRDEFIDHLCTGSDRQLDESLKPRLFSLKGRPHEQVKDEVFGMICDSRYCSLTSGFVLNVLQILWKAIGGTEEEEAEIWKQYPDPHKNRAFHERFKTIAFEE